MPRIPFLPPPGCVTDDTSFKDEGRVIDMSGMRWRNGVLETRGGSSQATANPGSTVVGIFGWDRSGTFMTAYGTATQFYTATGTGAVTVRTPATLSGVTAWSFASWGSDLLASSSNNQQLSIWTGGATASYVATAPAKAVAMIVTPQRQAVLGGTNEEAGAAFNLRCIRWSDIEDYTDWTTAVDSNAGEQILDDSSGIRAMQVLGDGFIVLTGSSLWYATFLGLPGQTFKFDKIGATLGPTNPKLVCVMHGVVYWLGSDLKFRAWSPGSPITEMVCPITREMRDQYETTVSSASFMATLYREEEVWMFYIDKRDGGSTPTRHITFCRKESELAKAPVWIKGSLARSSMFDAGDNGVIMADTRAHLHEKTTNHDSLAYFYETGSFYSAQGTRRLQIQRFIPDWEVAPSASASLTIYSRDRANASETTHTAQTVTTSADKVDFRASGMILRARLSGNTASPMRTGKNAFDVIEQGDR